MHTYYPYQFEYQPQVHLRTDYPPHQPNPYSQYQDRAQQETQTQIQSSSQQQLYPLVSTPSTTIDTPTSAYTTCSIATPTTISSMPYYTPSPQSEMIFTDPLIRPHAATNFNTNTNDDCGDGDTNASPSANPVANERYYHEYDYEWAGEQSSQQQQHDQQPLVQIHPSQSQHHQQQPSLFPSPYSPVPLTPSPLHIHIPSPSQPRFSSDEPSQAPQVPPPRLTFPVRREREQPFKPFHPYAHARPIGAGQRENEHPMDGEGKTFSSATIPNSISTMPSSTSTPVHTTLSAQETHPDMLIAASPPHSTCDSHPALTCISSDPNPNTQKLSKIVSPPSSISISKLPSLPRAHSPGRSVSPVPSHEPTTPAPIFGLFGSYPLSRGQALPGPTCAPETSSGVMRLAITPGALAHGGGSGSVGHGNKKEKSEKTSGVAVVDPNTASSLSVNMTTAPSLDFSASASNLAFPNPLAIPASGALNNFNAPTLGLNGAPNSNSSTMAIRKPRMACYFCRKRKIACGPGPIAIALAQQAQAQAQAQAHQQQRTHPDQEQGLRTGDLQGTNTDDSDSKPNPPTDPSSSPSSAMSPMMSTLTPAQMQGQPQGQTTLQTLTGDEGPCNQCARRGLACERPTESKRGVRKGKSKKEKEKEAKEKEAKEKELKRSGERAYNGQNAERVKDGDQSDDGGELDQDLHEDSDLDGDADLDPDDEGEGGEQTNNGGAPCVSEPVTSASPSIGLSLSSPATTPKASSRSAVPPAVQKPPARGRGRPPKHLSNPPNNRTLTSTPVVTSASVKGGLRSMTGSFKWTPTTGIKVKGKGKGKAKGKKKDAAEAVADAVPLAGANVKCEDQVGQDTLMESLRDPMDGRQGEDEPPQDERSDNMESDDEMDDEHVPQNEASADESKNDDDKTHDSPDTAYHGLSTAPMPAIMDSETQIQAHAECPSSLPHQSSSLISSGPSNANDTISPPVGSHSNIRTLTPSQITIPYSDSYSFYTHPHPHPSITEHQQESFQHGPAIEDREDSTASISYTHADPNILENGDEAYHTHLHHTSPPALEPGDGMYVVGYSSHMMAQTHSHESMPAMYPATNASIRTAPYSHTEDSYNMEVETEMTMQQQIPSSMNVEGYDTHTSDDYPIESISGMGYDPNTQTQGYSGVGHEFYEYGYGYHVQYAM